MILRFGAQKIDCARLFYMTHRGRTGRVHGYSDGLSGFYLSPFLGPDRRRLILLPGRARFSGPRDQVSSV